MPKSTYNFEDQKEKTEVLNFLDHYERKSGTQLISFYLKSLTSDKINKLKIELSESKNIKSKKTQKAVQEGILTLIDVVDSLKSEDLPVAIFVHEKLYKVVKLPESLGINSYQCGKMFMTHVLKAYSSIRYGLCVLDTQSAAIGLLQNYNIKVLKQLDFFIPGKIKAGGQSQQRFEQTRKNLVKGAIDKVSQICNIYFKDLKLEKLLVGGVIPTTDLFYNSNTLVPELKRILQKPTPTCYTTAYGLYELLERNRPLYEEELKRYYYERDLFNECLRLKREGWISQKELLNYQNYEVLGCITTYEHSTDMYCNECKLINPLCDHQKGAIFVDKYFNSTSKYGIDFKNLYSSIYNLRLL